MYTFINHFPNTSCGWWKRLITVNQYISWSLLICIYNIHLRIQATKTGIQVSTIDFVCSIHGHTKRGINNLLFLPRFLYLLWLNKAMWIAKWIAIKHTKTHCKTYSGNKLWKKNEHSFNIWKISPFDKCSFESIIFILNSVLIHIARESPFRFICIFNFCASWNYRKLISFIQIFDWGKNIIKTNATVAKLYYE